MTLEPDKAGAIGGPSAYENWKAAIDGTPFDGALEVPLYTDTYVTGEIEATDRCPYSFLNAAAWHHRYPDGALAHRVTLRMDICGEHFRPSTPQLGKTDTSRYHGGSMQDEITSLMSVLMGIRLHAGGITRRFDSLTDHRGRPEAGGEVPGLPRPLHGRRALLRGACQQQNLNKTVSPLLDTYPRLSPTEAVALVRAARLYQSALWVAEAQPELSWLFLVSALEALATFRRVHTFVPTQVLSGSQPELVTLLKETGGPELVEKVADRLLPLLQATGRFIEFVLEFLPQAPTPRPVEHARLPWDNRRAMKKALSKIYEHRSRALHDGTPFPKPMCQPPLLKPLEEIPLAHASCEHDGVWTRADTPMLLHTFEHIARRAILNWWGARAEAAGGQPTSKCR